MTEERGLEGLEGLEGHETKVVFTQTKVDNLSTAKEDKMASKIDCQIRVDVKRN